MQSDMEDLLIQIRSALKETSSSLLDWKASHLALSSIAKGLDCQARVQYNPVIAGIIHKYKNRIDAYLEMTKDDIEQAEKIMKEEWEILENAEQDSTTMIDLCESETKLLCNDMTEELNNIIQGLKDCLLVDQANDEKDMHQKGNKG